MKYIKRSNTVVATVFYEKSYKNLKKFATSLKNQTDNDFDLIILNDRINKFSTDLLNKLNFKIFKTKGTINKIRIELINYCKRMKYKNIIFVDSDDSVDKKRVELSKKYLIKNNIVVNELNIFSKNNKLIYKNYISKRISNKFKFRNNELLDKNFLGLTNTSLNTNILKNQNLNKLNKAPIFDWAFWYMLLKNNTGIFISETHTNYINIFNSLTSFTVVKNYDNKIFNLKQKQIKFLKKEIGYPVKNFCKRIKKANNKNFFWWEFRENEAT